MNPRTFLRTFVEVENAAALVGASCLEARAAVSTLLMAQEYGWPTAQETLTDRQWWRLLGILKKAGVTVPDDFTGPSADPEAVSAAFLGPYGGSLLTLPGRSFVARQFISPLLTARMHGTVRRVEFDGSRWQVVVALRGRADQRVPLGMFVSCTEPADRSETSDTGSGCPRSPQPAARPGAPSGRPAAGAGAAGGCGPTGATSPDARIRAS